MEVSGKPDDDDGFAALAQLESAFGKRTHGRKSSSGSEISLRTPN